MHSSCRKHHSSKFLSIRIRFPANKFWRWLCISLLIFIAVVLFIIMVIYLALRPQKPQFYVQDALIKQLNITGDGLLTSALQFTIISRNPNDRIGVYYDRICASASYMYQQITAYNPLAPFYQGHNDANIISAVLNGNSVPLAPFVAERLRGEQQNGGVSVNVRIGGKIRWKVGTWTSGYYHLNVNCFAVMGFTGDHQISVEEGASCDVSV